MTYGVQTLSDRTPASPVMLIELRALRLWHWKEVLKASKLRDDVEFAMRECNGPNRSYFEERLTRAKARWTMHMGAVQTLNSFFDLGDTAEKDAG